MDFVVVRLHKAMQQHLQTRKSLRNLHYAY